MTFELLKRGYDSNSEIVQSTVEQLGYEIGLIRTEQRTALKSILLNLFFSDRKKIGVQRSNNKKLASYKNPFHIGQKSIRTVLGKLEPEYITQELGSHPEGKITTIQMTDRLNEYLFQHDWMYGSIELIDNHEPIVLKDSDKNLIEYDDSNYTNSVREVLNEYIQLLANTEITYKNDGDYSKYDQPKVTRVFNSGSYTRGGRIVGAWAHLPKEQRKSIKLNNEDTVEIDFPASTLNIIYRIETGAPCPYEEPYPVNIGDINVPKRFCKLLFNISTNVLSASRASNSFNSELEKKGTLKEFQSIGISTREIHHAIKDKHSSINHHLFKGPDYGAWLQFVESELMFSILDRLTMKGIPSLTVYDSFIVRKSDEDYVNTLMMDIAERETVRIANKYPYKPIEQ